jgi:hypothetical protein
MNNTAAFDFGIVDLLTGDSSTIISSPSSGALRTREWKTFTVDAWARALVGAKFRIAVQWSDTRPGFAASADYLDATYITANGWTRATTAFDLFAVAGAIPKTWFRFVAQGLDTSGSLAGGGQIRTAPIRRYRIPDPGTTRESWGRPKRTARRFMAAALVFLPLRGCNPSREETGTVYPSPDDSHADTGGPIQVEPRDLCDAAAIAAPWSPNDDPCRAIEDRVFGAPCERVGFAGGHF